MWSVAQAERFLKTKRLEADRATGRTADDLVADSLFHVGSDYYRFVAWVGAICCGERALRVRVGWWGMVAAPSSSELAWWEWWLPHALLGTSPGVRQPVAPAA